MHYVPTMFVLLHACFLQPLNRTEPDPKETSWEPSSFSLTRKSPFKSPNILRTTFCFQEKRMMHIVALMCAII